MKAYLTLLALAVVSIAGCGGGSSGSWKPSSNEPTGWIVDEKIRGGYIKDHNSTDITARMAQVGMNAIMVKFHEYLPGHAASLNRIEQWAAAAQVNRVHLFIAVNFAGSSEVSRLASYHKEVDRYGQVLTRTPCPLDSRYWNDIITARAVELAGFAQQVPVDGMVLDPEMYHTYHTLYKDPCFCDNCWNEYIISKKVSTKILVTAAPQRYSWLRDSSLLQDYENWQVSMVMALARNLERKVHAVNPRFILGALAAESDEWFMKPLRKGFGTPDMPMVIWSETTYRTGYSADIDKAMEEIGKEGSYCLLAGGVSILANPPSTTKSLAYDLARNGDGYWIFTLESLVKNPGELPDVYQARGTPEAYWNALDELNESLDTVLRL